MDSKEQLSQFIDGYMQAILFTDCDPSISLDEFMKNPEIDFCDGNIPYDVSIEHFSEQSRTTIANECEDFVNSNRELLIEAASRPGYSFKQAGHDYWLTRCGHGTGFWDRDELAKDDLGKRLTERCRNDERCVTINSDGTMIYY